MAAARRRNGEDLMKAILLAALGLFSSLAWAQAYPSKAVKVVIPYPAGSTPDIVGRTVSDQLHKALGQPFVVENRTGAGGNIGADAVAKSTADGYTLLVAINGPVAVNKYLYKNLPYDPDRDLQPISLLASAPQMLVVTPAVPAASFSAFLEYARRNPGRLSYGSAGSGSASHLTMELLKSDAKVFLVHIPYRGFPPALTDMLSGSIDTMFAIIPAVLPQVRAGRIKALAVTALKRSPLAPDVPSVAELGYPQLESFAWIGLLAPAGTPREIVARLSAETVKGMQTAETRDMLGKQGFDVVANSPEEFARWIHAESRKWSKVIQTSGATPD
jgi:tripartite-type tricarboxylate transporter receptor subunit TctC